MLHHPRRHEDRVAGTDCLLLHIPALGLPLDQAAPADHEVDLLEVGGVFDLLAFSAVFRVPVPVMGAVARRDLVDVEVEFPGRDDALHVSCFLRLPAEVLCLDVSVLDDLELCHVSLLCGVRTASEVAASLPLLAMTRPRWPRRY